MTEGRRQLRPPHPTGSLSDLRGWARSWIDQHPAEGVDPEVVVLSMTELVTNSMRHGRGTVVIDLRENSSVLVLGVTDHSDELPRPPVIDRGDEGGRGMTVVAKLASRWGVQPLPQGGKTVWCEFGR